MILVDFFSAECCKGTELVEGWYWHEDDSEAVGGPYKDEEAAVKAAQTGEGWYGSTEAVKDPADAVLGPAVNVLDPAGPVLDPASPVLLAFIAVLWYCFITMLLFTKF